MAQKTTKTQSRVSGSRQTQSRKSTAKKPTAKKTAAKKTTAKSNRQKENPTAALWLFASSLLLFALYFIEGASVWKAVHSFLFGVFSYFTVALPVLLLILACSVGLGKRINSVGFRLTLCFLAVILLCSITENFSAGYPVKEFGGMVSFAYQNGMEGRGGGVASLLIGWPLTLLCGKEAALVVMFILLFVDLMLFTGTSIGGILRFLQKIPQALHKGVQETYIAREEAENDLTEKQEKAQRAKERQLEKEEKRQRKLEERQSRALLEQKRAEMDALAKKQKKEQSLTAETQRRSEETLRQKTEKECVKAEKQAASQPEKHEPKAESNAAVEDLIHRILGKQEEEAFDLEETNELPAIAPEPKKEAQTGAESPAEKQPPEPEKERNTPIQMDIEVEQIEKAYEYPSVLLLKQPVNNGGKDVSEELRLNAGLLVETLESFGVKTKLVDISRGPTVTRYELQPAAGVKISKVTGLADDIALNLAAAGVRIEAPIPNKAAIGIEVPNKSTDIVTIREIIDTPEFQNAKSKLTVALGKDIAGNVVTADLSKMPHTLIAGATGSGKSVCINSLLISILYKAQPSEVRLLLVDPKVVELGIYNGIPHLLVPVVTDPRKAAGALQWAVNEMLRRYNEFAEKGVRDIKGYNTLAERKVELKPMPQVVIVIDELADLMMAAPNEVEDSICRLAQMARAAGMYLVIATQRPSVDVITGIIKANIPSRIAFAVSSQVDSRTILDAGGAEKLLGKGDMLFSPSSSPKPVRVQGCFVTDKEVEEVVQFVSGAHQSYDNQIMEEIEQHAAAEKNEKQPMSNVAGENGDPLFEQAVACVMEAGQASTSYIQRKLKIGYSRAARLMDEMEEKRIVGPSEGSKPRQILREKTDTQ